MGYVAALIIGDETAAMICTFIYKQIIPILIYITTSCILLGLLAMYLAGEKALTPSTKIKKKAMEASKKSTEK